MIVAGFGFRQAASTDSLHDAFHKVASGHAISVIATVTDKAAVPAFKALGARLDVSVVAITPEQLTAQNTDTNAPASHAAYGTGSVAEAAALAAAGPNARLLGPRIVSDDRMATCALAEGDKQ